MSDAPALGPVIAALLFAGWCLAAGPGGSARASIFRGAGAAAPRGVPAGPRPRTLWRARRGARGPGEHAEQFQRAAILVGQLAALLRAGRTPEQMWRQACAAHSADEREPGDPTGRVLSAAATAAGLGRPVASAMRTVAADSGIGGGSCAAAGIWMSVAACIETAEASGGALADVLERFAGQLEADADAAAARTVALAGPRATAQVLSVLPVAGLGLGMLMGANPFGILLSTPLGALCLGLGAGLTVVGRWWSERLVRTASEAR